MGPVATVFKAVFCFFSPSYPFFLKHLCQVPSRNGPAVRGSRHTQLCLGHTAVCCRGCLKRMPFVVLSSWFERAEGSGAGLCQAFHIRGWSCGQDWIPHHSSVTQLTPSCSHDTLMDHCPVPAKLTLLVLTHSISLVLSALYKKSVFFRKFTLFI